MNEFAIKINKIKDLIKVNPNFVFLSGAGVSTASGIPDFRGKNGLYKKFKNAEYFLSIDALLNDTAAFYDFYKNQMILKNIQPNIVHYTLAK
jgi:NAD-dependent deacetylase